MKKKNRGFTTIELLICFAIISVITISMFNVILNYKNKQQIESIRSEIKTYQATLMKTLEDDLIKKQLTSVSTPTDLPVTFTFADGTNATLSVDMPGGVIRYGGINYPIPAIDSLEIRTALCEVVQDEGHTFLKITIELVHPDMDQDYGLYLVHPFGS